MIVPSSRARLAAALVLYFVTGSAQAADEEKSSIPSPSPGPAQTAPAGKAADAPDDAGASDLNPETIKLRIQSLESNKDLDPDLKKQIVDGLNAILQQYALADDLIARRARFDALIEKAPAAIKELAAKLNEAPAEEELEVSPSTTLPELEKLLAETEARLNDATQKAAEKENEPKRRAARRAQMPKLRADLKARHEKHLKELDAPPQPGQSAGLVALRRNLLSARARNVDLEIQALDRELAFYDATADGLRIESDLAAREAKALTKRAQALRDLVAQRRRREVEVQKEEAERAAAEAMPSVKALAEANAAYADRRAAIAGLLDEVSRRQSGVQQELERLEEQASSVRKRVEAGGITAAVGMLLRKQAKELGDTRAIRRAIARRRTEIARVQLELIDLEAARNELADIESKAEQMLAELPASHDEHHREFVRLSIVDQLTAQRGYLDSLLKDQQSYFEKLIDLDASETRLADATDQFAGFIAERVLWTRSSAPLDRDDIDKAWQAMLWLFNPAHWRELPGLLWRDFLDDPLLYTGAILALCIAGALQHRFRRELRRIGRRVGENYTETILETLVAIVLTGLMACFVPSVLWFLGWRLVQAPDANVFSKAVAAGLASAALVCLVIETMRQLFRQNGVAEAHFRWKNKNLREHRWALYWLLIFLTPVAFTMTAMADSGDELKHQSLGRLAFMFGMFVVSIVAYRLMRRSGAADAPDASGPFGGWLGRLRTLWFAAAAAVPLLLIVAAGLGFYDTAWKLGKRMIATVLLLWAIMIINAFLLRWLFAVRGKIALFQLQLKNEAGPDEENAHAAGGVPAVPTPEPIIDLSKVNAQTRHLLRTTVTVALLIGVWMIWVDVLPALGIFEQIEVWHQAVKINEEVRDPTGGMRISTVERVRPITLADLMRSSVVLLMTLAAARNLPGFLEIWLLKRLPLDPGGRYAIATLCRYAITAMGVLFACWMVGIGWLNVQWLFAAFSVGLGFGLQEIFANFISGIIVLFERPIRIGDIITVGDLTGSVSRIRIRATTITDPNRKEIVIPNKEFITGKLINWTLSDRTLRLAVNVGVAYGTDIRKAQSILLHLAESHPLSMQDPPPRAFVDSFGDSAINFVVFVYVANIDNLLTLKHEMHQSIAESFRDAGIEIAFPQRDLHLRSIEPKVPVQISETARKAA